MSRGPTCGALKRDRRWTAYSSGPKAAGSVTVVFEPTLETPVGVVSAKLFVRCESKPELPPWVFYLKGKIEEIDANAAPAGVSGKKK